MSKKNDLRTVAVIIAWSVLREQIIAIERHQFHVESRAEDPTPRMVSTVSSRPRITNDRLFTANAHLVSGG
jgi:hypothetical protein